MLLLKFWWAKNLVNFEMIDFNFDYMVNTFKNFCEKCLVCHNAVDFYLIAFSKFLTVKSSKHLNYIVACLEPAYTTPYKYNTFVNLTKLTLRFMQFTFQLVLWMINLL